MSWYDWLLLLHVLSAFSLVAALVAYTSLIAVGWRTDRPSSARVYFLLDRPATVLLAVGSIGTLAFGIWLAIYVDGYEIWDGWILAAIVVWAVAMETSRRTGLVYAKAKTVANRLGTEGNDAPNPELAGLLRSRHAVLLHAVTVVAILAILVLMIFKPGA